MVEFDTSKIGYSLKLDGKYYNTLDIEGFSHMMRDPSYCYKFYWLEAIVQLIAEGVKETTFDEINISDVSDGVYIGEYDVNFIYAKVEVTVQNDLQCMVLGPRVSHPSERNANRWTSKRWIGESCK